MSQSTNNGFPEFDEPDRRPVHCRQFTISVIGIVWVIVPLVAVMVSVYVPVGVPAFPDPPPPLELPPPQAIIDPSNRMTKAANRVLRNLELDLTSTNRDSNTKQ